MGRRGCERARDRIVIMKRRMERKWPADERSGTKRTAFNRKGRGSHGGRGGKEGFSGGSKFNKIPKAHLIKFCEGLGPKPEGGFSDNPDEIVVPLLEGSVPMWDNSMEPPV